MSRPVLLRLPVLLLALALVAPAAADVPKDTFEVRVALGGRPAAGVTVKAIGEPPGGGEVGYGEAATGPDGVARFHVPHRPGLQMHAHAIWQGVDYESEKVAFGADPAVGLAVPLTVYARAGEGAEKSLAFGPGSHLVVEVIEGALDVTESFVVSNGSKLAIVPPGGLVIPLPKGFRDVKGVGGNPVEAREGIGAAVPGPFLPGDTNVSVRFELPYSGTDVPFRQELRLPMRSVRLVVDESPNLQVAGEGVTGQDTRESEGRQFRVADVVTRAGVLDFHLEGLPHQVNDGRWIALGLSIAILLGGVVFLVGGRKERGAGAAQRRAAESERDALLADLEQLEHDVRSGEVSAQDYRKDRRLLLGRLADALRTLEARR